MQAIVQLDRKHSIKQTVEREQQVSIDVLSIRTLKIRCIGDENQFCKGLYSISLS